MTYDAIHLNPDGAALMAATIQKAIREEGERQTRLFLPRLLMTKRTILLIEDEEAISEPLAAALAREGFDTLVAGTAAKGLELFASRTPDLVLLDVMLPDGTAATSCGGSARRPGPPSSC